MAAPIGLLSQSSRGRVDVEIETFPYFLLARVLMSGSSLCNDGAAVAINVNSVNESA